MSGQELESLLMQIRYDATAIQAKVSDALKMLAALNLSDPTRSICPHCGLSLKGPRSLENHLYLAHDGPRPADPEVDPAVLERLDKERKKELDKLTPEARALAVALRSVETPA